MRCLIENVASILILLPSSILALLNAARVMNDVKIDVVCTQRFELLADFALRVLGLVAIKRQLASNENVLTTKFAVFNARLEEFANYRLIFICSSGIKISVADVERYRKRIFNLFLVLVLPCAYNCEIFMLTRSDAHKIYVPKPRSGNLTPLERGTVRRAAFSASDVMTKAFLKCNWMRTRFLSIKRL